MDAFCEMGLSDALVSALHKAEPRPYTGLLFCRGGKHGEFSKVHLSLSDLFGFLQEVQLANIGVTVL